LIKTQLVTHAKSVNQMLKIVNRLFIHTVYIKQLNMHNSYFKKRLEGMDVYGTY